MSSRRALLMKRSDGHCSNIYAGSADSLMSRKILEQIARRPEPGHRVRGDLTDFRSGRQHCLMAFDPYGETEMLAFPLIPIASKIAPEIV
jgi:hypothetical protein